MATGCASQFTPVVPVALLPRAAAVPATCVPWKDDVMFPLLV